MTERHTPDHPVYPQVVAGPQITRRPLETEEVSEQAVSDEPPMYRVLLLNDDFTPMDFVVQVLMQLFGMSFDQANAVMLEVHHHGRGVCGEFTREIAETRVSQVNQIAREHEYPLMCVMERAE
ncbi:MULTISPECIES: ATP-dependent Clp protease adapter ClpS [unclassified Guyparkeria]|uniref:ATP-dependent Clp protease adapter ClpS n=1 Tax=unclassified Guyparkeria TaxID=2626246 RepID=UPI0009E83D25|nr:MULTISPECIES: ATP-dependent Clp protease adapter ClpS [unclassified Guyparkeria]